MRRAWLILVLVGAAALAAAAPAPGRLTGHERAQLYGIAQDTWRFYANDVDPATQLPMDNLGPGTTQGTYTSAANIGVYLWAVVAARDLHLISTEHAAALAGATLTEVQALKRFHGLLYQWYDPRTGAVLLNPGQPDCTETTPAQDNCWFLSAVDNGWYASGLIEVRQALPALRDQADALLAPMDFSLFYDARAQTSCNTNAALPGNPPTGQMYGGYYVGQGPAGYHNGALYSDPRIAIYMGMGRHQMPGDVWWRTWRTEPPQQCSTDPDFSSQGQWPTPGYWQTYTDPQSHRGFRVWEGHYVYPDTNLRFIPTFAGGMFEAPDGQPRRARDGVGAPQLRAGRPPVGGGPAPVRHRRPSLSGLGHLPVEYRRRHRRLRRFRRSRACASAPARDWRCAPRARPRPSSHRTPRRSP